MEVSNSFRRYDSTIQQNPNLDNVNQINKTGKIKHFLEAFKVSLSQRALSSKELKDPSIKFPLYNRNVLQYSENLELILKP